MSETFPHLPETRARSFRIQKDDNCFESKSVPHPIVSFERHFQGFLPAFSGFQRGLLVLLGMYSTLTKSWFPFPMSHCDLPQIDQIFALLYYTFPYRNDDALKCWWVSAGLCKYSQCLQSTATSLHQDRCKVEQCFMIFLLNAPKAFQALVIS